MKKVLFIAGHAVFLLLTALIVFYSWAKEESGCSKLQLVEKPLLCPGTGNDSVLCLMSYNMGYLSGMTNNLAVEPERELFAGNRKKLIKKLARLKPDLLALQEIDYGSRRSFGEDQHDTLASRFFPYSLKAVNWDKRYVPFPYWPPNVHFGKILSGQSIMSRWPLEYPQRLVLKEVASSPFYYRALYLDRLLVSVRVKHPAGDFIVMNIHAEAFDRQTREEQLAGVYRLFTETRKQVPVLLLGDFNSIPVAGEKSIRLFLNDPEVGCAALSAENQPFPPTFPSVCPAERIDYIFYPKACFEELDSGVLTDFGPISDHLPVYACLKIKLCREEFHRP